MGRFYNPVCFLSRVYLYMMFFHLDFCRCKRISAVYFIRKLFPPLFSKTLLQLSFFQAMLDYHYRKAA